MGDVPAAFAVAPPVGGSGKHRNRVYETWQGNERFFCWGYLMAGPNWRAVFGTAFLVAAPTGIFLAFVASYLLFEVNAALMVFACILPALSLLFLFMTACRDPGVIARQEPDEEYLAGRKPRTKELFVNNQRVLIRYNDTCHFYQPPRAHHCSVNDNCIERFDHHCPWVGTTIGRRNYRTFLLFIYTTTVLCLYVMGCCLAQLFVKHGHLADDARAAGSTHQQWGATVRHVIPALVLLGYTFLLFWFVGGLSMFHCYLVARNQTTYENFRYTHDSRPNPYSRGIFGNCADVWCTPLPPSHVDFRAYVDEAVHRPPVYPEGDAGDPPTDGGGGGGADGGGGGGGAQRDPHEHDARTSAALFALGECYIAQGMSTLAEETLRRSLDVMRGFRAVDRLACVLYNQGRYTEAEVLFREELSLLQALRGLDHPHLAATLHDIADCVKAQDRFAEAAALYGEALALRMHLLGVEHQQTQLSQQELDECLQCQACDALSGQSAQC